MTIHGERTVKSLLAHFIQRMIADDLTGLTLYRVWFEQSKDGHEFGHWEYVRASSPDNARVTLYNNKVRSLFAEQDRIDKFYEITDPRAIEFVDANGFTWEIGSAEIVNAMIEATDVIDELYWKFVPDPSPRKDVAETLKSLDKETQVQDLARAVIGVITPMLRSGGIPPTWGTPELMYMLAKYASKSAVAFGIDGQRLAEVDAAIEEVAHVV